MPGVSIICFDQAAGKSPSFRVLSLLLGFHLYSTPLFPHIYMPSTSYLLFARPLPLTSKRNLLQGNSPLTEGNAAKLSSLQAPDYGLYFADLFRSIVCSVLLP